VVVEELAQTVGGHLIAGGIVVDRDVDLDVGESGLGCHIEVEEDTSGLVGHLVKRLVGGEISRQAKNSIPKLVKLLLDLLEASALATEGHDMANRLEGGDGRAGVDLEAGLGGDDAVDAQHERVDGAAMNIGLEEVVQVVDGCEVGAASGGDGSRDLTAAAVARSVDGDVVSLDASGTITVLKGHEEGRSAFLGDLGGRGARAQEGVLEVLEPLGVEAAKTAALQLGDELAGGLLVEGITSGAGEVTDGLNAVANLRSVVTEAPFPGVLDRREIISHEALPLSLSTVRLGAHARGHPVVEEEESLGLFRDGVASSGEHGLQVAAHDLPPPVHVCRSGREPFGQGLQGGVEGEELQR